jgi:hypothetical protein
MGIESGRLPSSWISSAEGGKFADVVKKITEQVRQLGPAEKLIKSMPILPDDSASTKQLAASIRHRQGA